MTWDRIVLLIAAMCIVGYIIANIIMWSVSVTSAINIQGQRIMEIEKIVSGKK